MVIKTSGSQKRSMIVNPSAVAKSLPPMLHYNVDYDTLKPEDTIRNFVANIRAMVTKFETNKERIHEIEQNIVDLEHYIEINKAKAIDEGFEKVTDGNELYRVQARLLRERRACKNENDLLLPIYEYFHATEVLNRLSAVQGECSKAHAAIDMRVYTVRTDILDKYLHLDKQKDENPELADAIAKVVTA